MRVIFVQIGINQNRDGADSPLFSDGSFELIPPPDLWNCNPLKYGNTFGRNGQHFSDYIQRMRGIKDVSQQSFCDNPNFETLLYSEVAMYNDMIGSVAPGDLIAFYSRLKGWQSPSPAGLFLVGYFEIETARWAKDLTLQQLESIFAQSFYVRHSDIFQTTRERLFLVKGSVQSRRLQHAYPISEIGKNRSGAQLLVLSSEMQSLFGTSDVKVGFKWGAHKWVPDGRAEAVKKFIHSLE